MLQIKTYLAKSKIQGIGLFAAENIRKGQIIWKYNPNFDRSFPLEEYSKMPKILRDFIKKYSVLSTQSNTYVLSSDDARFTNHKRIANSKAVKKDGEIELISIATKDIKKDEEITINYRSIDTKDASSSEEYLNN